VSTNVGFYVFAEWWVESQNLPLSLCITLCSLLFVVTRLMNEFFGVSTGCQGFIVKWRCFTEFLLAASNLWYSFTDHCRESAYDSRWV